MDFLFEKLKKNKKIPMHMPGHKRNAAKLPYFHGITELDITEIKGFDNLHSASGILKESMELAAKLRGAKAAFYLVNGATCGILAAITSALSAGDKVIVARNCHKSVYNGIELAGAEPVFLYPEFDGKHGIFGSVTPQSAERAIRENPDVRLVIITSPTYEGVISDIKSICEAAHKKNIPVLVDAAHGAHLGFGGFCPDAVSLGADISIESLHKTLLGLTQTAICYLNGNIADAEKLAEKLAVFETSSPSYILLSSIDACIKTVYSDKESVFGEWESELDRFLESTENLKNIEILSNRNGSYFDFDKSKLVLFAGGMSGPELSERLRVLSIEPEAALCDHVICMTGAGDSRKSFEALKNALTEIDKSAKTPDFSASLPIPCADTVLPLQTAIKKDGVFCETASAVGRVSAGYVWAYPPGAPILIPGEGISDNTLNLLLRYEQKGVKLYGGIKDNKILVIK